MLGIGSVSSRSISGESLDLRLSAVGFPFVVLFERPHADEAGDRGLVGDYADALGAPLHFLVKTHDWVG